MNETPLLLRRQGYCKALPARSLDFQSRMVSIFGERLFGAASGEPRLLILTRTCDTEADAVGLRLTERGVPYLRVDADLLSGTRVFSSLEDSETAGVAIGADGERSCQPQVIWFRHFAPTAIPGATGEVVERSYVQMEWDLAMRSLLSSGSARWMNHPNVIHNLDRIAQLRLARSVGFATPRTLVSNDPERIGRFAESCGGGAVAKVIGSHFLELTPGNVHGIFPYIFQGANAHEMKTAAAAAAPCLYQEYVPHVTEVRITVVGEGYTAVEVDQGDPASVWENPDDVLVRDHELPAPFWGKLKEYMKLADIEYGAFDFLLSEDGDYVFLEVNPSGDWTWLEARHDGLDITGKVCAHIMGLLDQ